MRAAKAVLLKYRVKGAVRESTFFDGLEDVDVRQDRLVNAGVMALAR